MHSDDVAAATLRCPPNAPLPSFSFSSYVCANLAPCAADLISSFIAVADLFSTRAGLGVVTGDGSRRAPGTGTGWGRWVGGRGWGGQIERRPRVADAACNFRGDGARNGGRHRHRRVWVK